MANERRVSAAKALEIICASSDNDSDDLSSCDNDSGSDFIPECGAPQVCYMYSRSTWKRIQTC